MSSTDVKSKLGKEDLNQWGGNSVKTFTRRTSDGGLLTLHKFGNVVDVLQVYGDGSTPAHSNLTDAIVGAEGQKCCFELAPGTWPVTANLTIPSTVTILLQRGATFSVSAAVTLTLSGPVIAQESTWYSGAGTVVYTAGGGFFPLVSDLASVAAGKGAALIGATGTAKTVGDLFDGGKDVDIKPQNIDAGGTLAVAGASTVADLSASGTLGGKLAFRGAFVRLSAAISIANSTNTIIDWDSEDYDTSTIHDTVTNPSRLTVPAGVTRIKLHAQICFDANATGVRRVLIYKYGAEWVRQPYVNIAAPATGPGIIIISSPAYTVSATDYFTVAVLQSSGGALNLAGGNSNPSSYFAMEIIE